MKLFDAHCHLQMPQFDVDRGTILLHMEKSGTAAIVVGTDLETSRAGIALAEKHDFLWASVGLHPNDNLKEEFDISNYEKLAAHRKVMAVGECGLDYFRSGGTDAENGIASAVAERARQKERFEKQIVLALKIQKPIIIHCRSPLRLVEGEASAHDDMLEILFSYSQELQNRNVSVIIHFFTGSGELAQKYLGLGCYLSFPGPITYTDMYDESIHVCPLERMLIETDAPFAAPVPHRGRRNEPSYVVEVAKKVSAIKNEPFEKVCKETVLNARKVFSI